MTTLRTDRLTLRPWTPDDLPALLRYAQHPSIFANLRDRFPNPYTEEAAHAFIEMANSQTPVNIFAIDMDGEAIGSIGYFRQHDVNRFSAEIGYWMGLPFRGRGIVVEALSALCAHLFEHSDLIRLYASVFGRNPASRKVLERAGFQFEGVMRNSVVKLGAVDDEYLYALLRPGIAPGDAWGG